MKKSLISRMSRMGFTLIEMIVVLAILLILAALFLPVIKSAMEAARRCKCASNLQQIGVAFDLYATDHNGFFPPGGDASYPYSFYQVDQTTGSFIPGAYYLLADGGYMSSYTAPIIGTAGTETIIDAFFCPSYVANYGQSPANILYQNGGGGYVFWGGWPPDDGLYHSVQTIRDPSSRALVGDCVCSNLEVLNRSHLISKNNAAGANWLFVDGHVEWVPIGKLTQSQSLAGNTYLLPVTP